MSDIGMLVISGLALAWWLWASLTSFGVRRFATAENGTARTSRGKAQHGLVRR